MTTGKQAYVESAREIKSKLLAILDGMDYCLDWKQDSDEWSARETIYHILESPPGGIHTLIKGIFAGDVQEYDMWSDMTNVTPERATYDLPQITADIDSCFDGIVDVLSSSSDEALEATTVVLHQKSRGFDEERPVKTILERSLDGHMRDHLVQLKAVRDALGI